MTTKQRAESREQRDGGTSWQLVSLAETLVRCGPRRNVRRGRRGWGVTVLTVVTLLVVSACAGYLWHCVRAWMGTGWKAYATPVRGLAMWPVSGVIAWGVVGVCLFVLLVTWVKAWMERGEREAEAYEGEWDPYASERPWGGETERERLGDGGTGRLRDGETVRFGDGEAQAGKPMLLETTCPHCGKSMFVRREAWVGGLARYGGEGAV